MGAYLIFMSLNIVGVQIAAAFELTITLLAVFELLVFMGVVARISLVELHAGRLGRRRQLSMGTFGGILGAVPFAIWFFLAIEGVAMAAEEAKNPRRSIPIAYITGILTLVVLAMGVMLFAGGVGDWKLLADINDPLPQAMKLIVGKTAAGCTC